MELRLMTQDLYRANSSGYLNISNDTLNSFELSETAFQVRYKYQFAPLSDLYVVYTRGGKYSFNRENSFGKILFWRLV